MIAIDSNVWIYGLDMDQPEHGDARDFISGIEAAEEVLIPTVISMEVAHYLFQRTAGRAAGLWNHFSSYPAHRPSLSATGVNQAIGLLDRWRAEGIGVRDAIFLDECLRQGARLVTHDQAVFRTAELAGLEVIDPIGPEMSA